MPPREKGAKACLQDWAGHFLRSGLNVKDAGLRPFLAILRAIQADFSALQTVWRRGRHSNPRYRFESCKSPHVLNLQGINHFRILRKLPAYRAVVLNSAVHQPRKGEQLAILWLKQLRHNLAHLSLDGVRQFYERAFEDCRLIYNRLPSPRRIQTLVQVWKQLWKWR